MSYRTLYCSAIALLIIAGCSSGEPTGDIVETVPAGGLVTYQGKPLEYHQVTFFPTDGRPAVGVSDLKGKFILGTNQQDDGAVAGSHRVSVTYVGPPNENPDEGVMEFSSPPPPKVKIDRKYFNPETSSLTVSVPDTGSAELYIELK